MTTTNPYRKAFADADGDMPEYCTTIHGWLVAVDKDGGGTLGKEYTGTWTVSVMNGPVYVLDNAILNTGTPKTHEQVARLAYEFATIDDDDN
jgi:hypothetical protein